MASDDEFDEHFRMRRYLDGVSRRLAAARVDLRTLNSLPKTPERDLETEKKKQEIEQLEGDHLALYSQVGDPRYYWLDRFLI